MESGAERSREISTQPKRRGDCDTGDLPGKVPDTHPSHPKRDTTQHRTTSNVIKFVVNMVAPTPNPEAYPVSEMAVEAPAADPPSKDENKKPDISPQNSSEEQSVPDGSWAEPFNSKAEKLPKGANRTRL